MIRVLVADDQELVRDGLAMILGTSPSIDIVGRASDGAEAVALARTERPDVVLMDVRMPRVDGLTATALILREHPACKVLVLTTYHVGEDVVRALDSGASGYLLKDSPRTALVSAVHAAAAGDVLLDPAVARRLIEAGRGAPADPVVDAALARLTPRERDVLVAVASGATNGEIADQLNLGEATVKTHLARLLQKTGARDRVQLVVMAHRHRLV